MLKILLSRKGWFQENAWGGHFERNDMKIKAKIV